MNRNLIILIILLLNFSSAISQDAITEKLSPKVGLVLSGGGAKGLAHIGVLKVIDSLGVPIDYVAGTSMGAIVGSLYASGYSGKELDSIFLSADFDEIISDDLPRAVKAINDRENDEKYAIKLPFNNYKIKLPSALSRGHNAYNLLLQLTLHVNGIRDFSKLPIPFFCVATNVETGKQVILDNGNLTQSIMASGALPSLFQPVEIDGQLLVDGGVVNNYPIDELRAKGVDIIIGVDVQDGLAKRDELASAPEVLIQINNFRTINDMKLKSQRTDVYIKPNIKEFSVVSFNEGQEIIDSGKRGALAKLSVLRELANHKSNNTKVIKKYTDSITINNIDIEGNKYYTRSYILGKLKFRKGEKISYKNFIEGLNSLESTNNFTNVEYELRDTNYEEGYDLNLLLKEYKINTFLKFGIHYDDLYKSGALVNLTRKRLFLKNDIASLDLVFGDNVRYNFSYLIDKGFYWSVGITSRYNKFNKAINAQLLLDDVSNLDNSLNKIEAELQDQTNQFYLRTLFRRDFALSLGAEHKRLNVISETITSEVQDEFTFENTDYFSAFGGLKLDTYNDKYFPSKGVFFDSDLHIYLFASRFNSDFDRFSIAKATMGYAFSITNYWAFNFQTSGGFKIDDRSTTTLDFALGGYGNNFINNFVPFLGYDFISLTGNSYVKAYLSSDFEVFKNHHLTVEGNWANIDDDLFQSGEWFTLPDYRGYALGYAIDTFIGPIQVKYSYSPEAKNSVWFFNVGFWF